MRFSERYKIAPVYEPVDTEAGLDGDSINMGLLHELCYALTFGAVTGDAVLKFYVGATAGTKTTAIAFSYRLSAADFKVALADTYGALTAVASTGLTLAAATFDHRTALIEFDSQAIADATPWLTIELSAAASASLTACLAIGEPRHASNAGTPSVL
jgi:hypothetical protein